MASYCPECGVALEPGVIFCGNCGTKIEAPAKPETTSSSGFSFNPPENIKTTSEPAKTENSFSFNTGNIKKDPAPPTTPPSYTPPSYQPPPSSGYQAPSSGYQQPPNYRPPGYNPSYQAPVNRYQTGGWNAPPPLMERDHLNIFYYIISFLIPLIGLIVWLNYKNTKPNAAKNVGITALVGFFLLYVI